METPPPQKTMDPVRKLPPPDSLAADEARAPSDCKILVVDDYDDAREMYAEYLEFLGFQVDVARNGVEAVEKARRDRITLT